MNNAIIIGNLTRDPEGGSAPGADGTGIAFCRFTIAANRPFTNAAGEREADDNLPF
ncbi:MAG: single-stranded DNA-binding protein [Clostridiales bacterium]|jgi:single-strand DNA-binding protein|nr:single-stranded DNA-binding protein [Clostridiales bacterium]